METNKKEKNKPLGNRLKSIRIAGSFGKIEDFCKILNVNKNTLGAYERSERLPDIEFLAFFSDVTNYDFNELLVLRLISSPLTNAIRKGDELMKLVNAYENNNFINHKSSVNDDAHETSLKNAIKLLINNYSGRDNAERDMIITMLLSELKYTQDITDNGSNRIIETLQKIRKIEKKS